MKVLGIFAILAILTGCATTGGESGERQAKKAPKIDRLSEEQLARILPKPVSQLSFEALVKLSQEGRPAKDVIAKLQETDTSYDLTPTQMLGLNKKGVDMEVLDYLHESRLEKMQANLKQVVSERDKKKNNEINQLKRALVNRSMMGDPFCRGPFLNGYPYGRLRLGIPWYY